MGYGWSRNSVTGRALSGLAWLAALGGAIAVGCALNPQPEPPLTDRSGAGGSSGTGAQSGTSGGAGGLGTGGTIGVGTGGSGGASAGSGGTTPDSDSGAGATGSDGGPPSFEDCATAPPSTCTPAATCEALGDCGAPTSLLDESGCLRARCAADTDCGTGQRCLPTSLVSGCEPPALASCAPDSSGACVCHVAADCGARAQCVPESLAPREADCSIDGHTCEQLLLRAALVTVQLHSGLSPELVDALDACRVAIQTATEVACR